MAALLLKSCLSKENHAKIVTNFVPNLINFLSFNVPQWYPESARYYLVSNQTEKAVDTLKWMADMNKAQLPKGKLVEMDACEQRGNVIDLLKPKMRRTTLLFWYIW